MYEAELTRELDALDMTLDLLSSFNTYALEAA